MQPSLPLFLCSAGGRAGGSTLGAESGAPG